ncbi:hypothetical protein LRS10_11610 [Phenylobacterium sp. J426]|uniref:hypothetical protein n=1 Tax=Phenylobacterium sp. J426 TaxID=2898439 RepID=UPI00215148C5|nr:hypothetical protein [Phenylobacterium sp. J426]MCR5874755.1 hypothetical protein [Phenylobacterium sp. J426]
MNRLLQPLAYWRIRHPAKWRYDLGLPAAVAVPLAALLLWGPLDLNLVGQNGLLDKINGLIGILSGFFIAALAAVATFDRPSMDDPMPGDPPKLRIVERGAAYDVAMSRRLFLSMLFGYLSLASFGIYFFGSVLQLAAQADADISARVMFFARPVLTASYLFVVSNIFVNTALGIYYLSYRLHDVTSKLVQRE